MTSGTSAFARQLRRTKTIPERKLWRELRVLNEAGHHFRQQAPLGKYVVDFAELSSQLVIEIDGDDHATPLATEHDAERTRWLASEGNRVVRFGNRDVLQNLPGVIDAIRMALAERVFPLSSIDQENASCRQSLAGGATPTPALPTRGRGKEDSSADVGPNERHQSSRHPE